MNTFLTICLIVLPLSLLMGFAAYLARQSAKGMPVKRTLSLNITAFVVVLLLASCFAFTVSAEGEATTAVMTAAERAASNESMGLGLIAAALVTGLAGIGGGMAVAAGAPAAIAAASEDPKSFGKSLIFVALGESIALYGVVISILILNKLVYRGRSNAFLSDQRQHRHPDRHAAGGHRRRGGPHRRGSDQRF